MNEQLSLPAVGILSAVEGLTEFIPVSSTGHLILAGHLLGLQGEQAKSFAILIQAGAILAVLVLYSDRFKALLNLNIKGDQGFQGARGCRLLLLGCLPALIVGGVFGASIKQALFSPAIVGCSLIIGAVLMLLAEHFKPATSAADLEHISPHQAWWTGVAQVLSLIPGMSRAAMSILGGLACGMDRKTAAEFSFLMAVPLILAATAYDVIKNWELLATQDLTPFFIGFVLSFLMALIAMKTFLALLRTWTLRPFAYYRLVIGILVLILLEK